VSQLVSSTVARKMLACAEACQGNTVRKTMLGVGVLSKQLIESEVRKDFGADLGMSNWRRGRVVKLKSGFDQTADDTLVMKFRPHGPWMVAERGRRAGSRSTVRRRNGRQSPSSWGSSRGKNTYTRSKVLIIQRTPRFFQQTQTKAIVDAFSKG
jgi:hypothetical protein